MPTISPTEDHYFFGKSHKSHKSKATKTLKVSKSGKSSKSSKSSGRRPLFGVSQLSEGIAAGYAKSSGRSSQQAVGSWMPVAAACILGALSFILN
eukprot:scaffold2153_cov174-Alexandrium_tamarense.AAC.3